MVITGSKRYIATAPVQLAQSNKGERIFATEEAYYDEVPSKKFKLSEKFVEKFKDQPAPFGFNGLGEIVYKRTYSRVKENGENEQWWETVERVVNGTYNMQKRWIEAHQLGWNARRAQKSAQEMYTRIFQMKFLPPGRGLWAMGSPLTEKKGIYAALNNCAFVSTESMRDDPSKPFVFLMDLAMLGVGVGFDTKGAETISIYGPDEHLSPIKHVVADSREGWVESLKVLLDSYFIKGSAPVEFDYSEVRPAGEPIKGFGGVASGPESLKKLHGEVKQVLERRGPISVTSIVDIMNYIGKCVVAGNIRQTAEIAFGDPTSEEFINLKNYEINPHRSSYGWTSNNSIFAKIGMNYGKIVDRIIKNGEPGFAWLENMQQYSRMNGIIDNKDFRARGGNPCLEQTLESYEMCCLVETFPNNHETLEDYIATLKMAFLYAKTVTLAKTHWPESNRVMLRNRRVGCSMSGIAQFICQRGIEVFRIWCEQGYDAIQQYDRRFSDLFAIPSSIKTTSIKPSGTVSLLAGATPGMHYPESRFYIRRVRLAATSNLTKVLRDANYPIEPASDDPINTIVVEFPIDVGQNIRVAGDLSMWEQLSLASFLQEHWADNQVSCTVTFDPKTEASQLEYALDYFQYKLKGISFLPRFDIGQKKAYPQMPYEEITEEEYNRRVSELKPLQFQYSLDLNCWVLACSS
jgi:ribonucleoside-triphosphate reductase